MKKLTFILCLLVSSSFFAVASQAANPLDSRECIPGNQGNCDRDDLIDARDNCRTIPNDDQGDFDNDGLGDACDDSDNDGSLDDDDNCVEIPNPNQADIDNDGEGDACADNDFDDVADGIDNCPQNYNPNQNDRDSDGVGDTCDNCPAVSNSDQADVDPLDPNDEPNGFGYVCELDFDGDRIPDDRDNCPSDSNNTQRDSDRDGRGDVCDQPPTQVVVSPGGSITPPTAFRSNSGGCSLRYDQSARGNGLLSFFAFLAVALTIGVERATAKKK